MPGMPWTPITAQPDREYVVMATRFVLTHHWQIPAVLRSTQALWPRLTTSEGFFGSSLEPDLRRRTLNTVSVWRDRDVLGAFVRSEAHSRVVAQTRPCLASSTFATWTVLGAQLPVPWVLVRERLDAATNESAPAVEAT